MSSSKRGNVSGSGSKSNSWLVDGRGAERRFCEKATLMRSTVVISLSLYCVLAGCMSSGNESIADATGATVAGQLIKGKTTQTDVRRLYGDPIKTSFSANGFETWEYEFTRLQSKPTNFIPYVNLVHSGAEGDKKGLVIFFDKQKIVQDYTMSTSRIDILRALLRGSRSAG